MNRHPFCLRCGSDISTCVCPEDLRAYPVIQRLEAENAQLKQQIAKLEAEAAILDGFVEQRDLKLNEAAAQLQSKDAELQDCQKQLLDRVDASNAHYMKLKCDLVLKEAEIQLPENQRILEIRREERLKIAVEALEEAMLSNDTIKIALERIAEKGTK